MELLESESHRMCAKSLPFVAHNNSCSRLSKWVKLNASLDKARFQPFKRDGCKSIFDKAFSELHRVGYSIFEQGQSVYSIFTISGVPG